MRTFVKKEYDRDENSKGCLENDVHIPKEIEDKFQIYVLKLDYFRLWNAISAFLGHSQ
jgi:hypothetical protein